MCHALFLPLYMAGYTILVYFLLKDKFGHIRVTHLLKLACFLLDLQVAVLKCCSSSSSRRFQFFSKMLSLAAATADATFWLCSAATLGINCGADDLSNLCTCSIFKFPKVLLVLPLFTCANSRSSF